MSIASVLPDLNAGGAAQMALDDGLLQTVDQVVARRYTWTPPALSIGKFQRLQLAGMTPFDVVRRPSGGRAVLHGDEFEWSFAVVVPLHAIGASPARAHAVAPVYTIVVKAFSAALQELGVHLDAIVEETRGAPAFCFSHTMRHDLLARGEKIMAVAQARAGDRVLIHGSVLERRPPAELLEAAEVLLGEPWSGEGLAGAGYSLVRETVWRSVLAHLEANLRALCPM